MLKVRNIIHHPSWSFIALIFSLALLFFQKKTKDFQIRILNETNLINLHKNLGKLSIFYDEIDIKKSQKNLRTFTLNFENKGNMTLFQNDYDKGLPIGLAFKNSIIIETPIIASASNNNLRTRVNKSLKFTNDTIKMIHPIPVFEKSDFVTIVVTVIYNESSPPMLSPIGKIGGQDEIKLKSLRNNISSDKKGFLSESIRSNSIIVQLFRILIYSTILFLIYNIGFQIFRISKKIKSSFVQPAYKKKFFKAFNIPNKDSIQKINAIFDIHSSFDKEGLYFLKGILDQEKERLIDVLKGASPNHIFLVDLPSYDLKESNDYEEIINKIKNLFSNVGSNFNYEQELKHFETLTDSVIKFISTNP